MPDPIAKHLEVLADALATPGMKADPSTPVPSDEAVAAALRVAQVRRLPGSQAAVDQIVSAALTAAAPIIAAEAAAEARAATLREVIEQVGRYAPWLATYLRQQHFDPEEK